MSYTLDDARHFFSISPYMVELGVQPVAIGEGRLTSVLAIEPRHLQHTGQVHAGVIAAMADQSMGAAAQTLAGDGVWIVTAELKSSNLRPAKGERLVCEALVLKPGKRVSFTEAEVYAESDAGRTLVAKASATMALTSASRD
jgi:uncharacterized protein (TIGR00369 family)